MNLNKEVLCQEFLLPSVIIRIDGTIHHANAAFHQLFSPHAPITPTLCFTELFQQFYINDENKLDQVLLIKQLALNSHFFLTKIEKDQVKAYSFAPLFPDQNMDMLFIVSDDSDKLQQLFIAEQECEKLSKDCQSFVQVLMKSEEQTKQAIQAKKSFLANMSHEMNTPLNAVLGFAQLLKVDDPNQQRYVSGVIDAGQNLGILISDILDIASYSSGQLILKELEVSIPQLIKDASLLWEMRCFDYDIDFEVKTNLNYIQSVILDAPRFRQILSSLMSNAIKFSRKPGKIILRIQLKDNGNNDTCSLIINVIDNGIGISKQQLPQMFEMFNRGCNDLAAKYSGAGIGLPIASALVELMGGKISVQSSLAKGSIFSVLIPELKVLKRDLAKKQSAQASSKTTANRVKKSILIVEDEPLNRMVLAKMISQMSNQIFQAANSDEAMKALLKDPIDLVVMDIDLPGMNGIELAKLMQVMKAYQNIPIVACTALPVDELPTNSAAYFKDILPKPVKQMVLIKSLKKALNLKVDDL